ncbi:winged helix-turn-helix transcriptional regulator [Gordonia aurantiaca]|uniref:winged helix-turn-helix transcriptional regulator n=1 Tax=Gordonia sp. B21 TaxID=3151852 RepID=UPI0032630380
MDEARSATTDEVRIDDVLAGSGIVRAALETIGGVWPMMVLIALDTEPRRYGELRRAVTGINDRMLSQTLHRFVRDGLVDRGVMPTRRSCVLYTLTDLGVEVRAAVADFTSVIIRLAPRVGEARERFDRQSGEESS